MGQFRSTPFHRALHRPQTVMGGERELTLFSMLIAGGLIVSGMNLVQAVVGTALWFICLHFLRQMAKVDPNMSKVYIRHLQYGTYYPARSTPFRKG